MSAAIADNPAEHRFELKAGDHLAIAAYRLAPGALEQARARGLKVVPRCSFIAAFIAKNAEFGDLVS